MRKRDIHAQARRGLKAIIEIAKNEMLHPGEYVTTDVVNRELADAGAVCTGRRVCAIGSLYLGALGKGAIKVERRPPNAFRDYWIESAKMPGVFPEDREEFMEDKPGLKLAYDLLNAAAERYIKANKIDEDGLADPNEFGYAEGLFEGDAFDSVADTRQALVAIAQDALNDLAAL